MSYKLTTYKMPNPDCTADLHPPEEGWVPCLLASPRTDQVVVLWREPGPFRMELDGRSVEDVEALGEVFGGESSDKRPETDVDRPKVMVRKDGEGPK